VSFVSSKPIFDAVRTLAGALSQSDVDLINAAILAATKGGVLVTPKADRDVSERCIVMMQAREGLRLSAYPDPGSKDGNPWTCGYGSTGPDVKKGTVWTAEYAHQRFVSDVRRFEDGVVKLLGDAPTTQGQFDALVSFAYNVGLKALSQSTLLREHLAGRYAAAQRQFVRWVFNDGVKMDGLVTRRAEEAALYKGDA
jgi:lysozyme